jgi:NAD(P)H dehydrogenase (quinone)
MKKILLNGVDGNFGGKSAKVLLDRYPHEDLIFTAPTEKGLEKYKGLGVELRVADFNDENLSDAFVGADTMVLMKLMIMYGLKHMSRSSQSTICF